MFDAIRPSFTVYFLFSFLFSHLPKGLTEKFYGFSLSREKAMSTRVRHTFSTRKEYT